MSIREEIVNKVEDGDYSFMLVGVPESGIRQILDDVHKKLVGDGYCVVSKTCTCEGSDEDFVTDFFGTVDKAVRKNALKVRGKPVVVVAHNFDVIIHLSVDVLKTFTCGLVARHDDGKIRLLMESNFPCSALMRRVRDQIRGRTTFEHAVEDIYLPVGQVGILKRNKCISNLVDVFKKTILDPEDQKMYRLESLYELLIMYIQGKAKLPISIQECLLGYGVLNGNKEVMPWISDRLLKLVPGFDGFNNANSGMSGNKDVSESEGSALIVIDMETGRVSIGSDDVHLNAKQLAILCMLALGQPGGENAPPFLGARLLQLRKWYESGRTISDIRPIWMQKFDDRRTSHKRLADTNKIQDDITYLVSEMRGKYNELVRIFPTDGQKIHTPVQPGSIKLLNCDSVIDNKLREILGLPPIRPPKPDKKK